LEEEIEKAQTNKINKDKQIAWENKLFYVNYSQKEYEYGHKY